MEPLSASKEQTELDGITNDIAAQLGETEEGPVRSIQRIIEILGEDEARTILAEAIKIDAGAGLMIRDGSRRRTLGGVFFYLARPRVPRQRRAYIWPHLLKNKKKLAQPQTPPFAWEDRLVIAPVLIKEKGDLRTMKVTLIGRPGKVVEKGAVILTSMAGGKPPALPKGLPLVPDEQTTYIVFIAKKQWHKVKESIKNPEDVLIVEGYQIFDKRLKTITVFAQSTTTKLLQRARREVQKAKAQG